MAFYDVVFYPAPGLPQPSPPTCEHVIYPLNRLTLTGFYIFSVCFGCPRWHSYYQAYFSFLIKPRGEWTPPKVTELRTLGATSTIFRRGLSLWAGSVRLSLTLVMLEAIQRGVAHSKRCVPAEAAQLGTGHCPLSVILAFGQLFPYSSLDHWDGWKRAPGDKVWGCCLVRLAVGSLLPCELSLKANLGDINC